jgi:hypothetical protein
MGVRILENAKEGMAVMYDSVTETAFGPVFRDLDSDDGPEAFAGEVAETFLRFQQDDPRTMLPQHLQDAVGDFLLLIEEQGWDAVSEEVSA